MPPRNHFLLLCIIAPPDYIYVVLEPLVVRLQRQRGTGRVESLIVEAEMPLRYGLVIIRPAAPRSRIRHIIVVALRDV